MTTRFAGVRLVAIYDGDEGWHLDAYVNCNGLPTRENYKFGSGLADGVTLWNFETDVTDLLLDLMGIDYTSGADDPANDGKEHILDGTLSAKGMPPTAHVLSLRYDEKASGPNAVYFDRHGCAYSFCPAGHPLLKSLGDGRMPEWLYFYFNPQAPGHDLKNTIEE